MKQRLVLLGAVYAGFGVGQLLRGHVDDATATMCEWVITSCIAVLYLTGLIRLLRAATRRLDEVRSYRNERLLGGVVVDPLPGPGVRRVRDHWGWTWERDHANRWVAVTTDRGAPVRERSRYPVGWGQLSLSNGPLRPVGEGTEGNA